MNRSPVLQLPRRGLRSFALVVLIHALIVWGLASGLARDVVKKVVTPALWIEEPIEPEKIVPPKLDLPKPEFVPPATPVIPAPEVQVDRTPSPITVAVEPEPGTAVAVPSGPSMAAEDASESFATPRPEALCSVMVAPKVPPLNWEGLASFRIHAQLQSGRVADVKVLSTSGGMDGRTRRTLLDSVQAALGAYQCRGNQGFEQEFVFKILR